MGPGPEADLHVPVCYHGCRVFHMYKKEELRSWNDILKSPAHDGPALPRLWGVVVFVFFP